MAIITAIPTNKNKVASKQLGRIKLVRKMDRILRNHPKGTNPLHHHPSFNGKSYHFGDIAKDLGLTRSQVQKIDKAAHSSKSKKAFAISACKTLNIAPALVDSRW